MRRAVYNFCNRHWEKILLALMFAVAATIALLLTGCGPSAARRQHAADALAGVAAVATLPPGEISATAATILGGLPTRIEAAVGLPASELPQPTMSATAIRAAPVEYSDTAPPSPPAPGWLMNALGVAVTVLLAGGGAAALIRRLVPGPAGVLLNLAWDIGAKLLAPRLHTEDKGLRALLVAAREVHTALDISIEFFPDAAVKDRLAAARDRLKAILDTIPPS